MNQTKKDIIFILSIDTEEEWDWSGDFPHENFSVENIHEIPAFQLFCQEVGIKPTYFVDYAVANNPIAANTLSQLNSDFCEIGSHLHPWVNPPFFNDTSEKATHVVNLPIEQVQQKLLLLNQKIIETLGHTPKSFRTGRWGINGDILNLLHQENFSVDSSIYPFYSNNYFSCENAPIFPYWPDSLNTNKQTDKNKQPILEIPVTVGFNRTSYYLGQKIHKFFEKRPFTWLRLNGLLWHSKILRKLYLSPELCTAKDMITLIETCIKKDQTILHMYLHSSSLIENVTGLTSYSNARETISHKISTVIAYLKNNHSVTFCTISEASKLIQKRSSQHKGIE